MNHNKERITITFYSPGVDNKALKDWIEETLLGFGILGDVKLVSESLEYNTDDEVERLVSYIRTCDNTSQSDMSVAEVRFREKVDLYGLEFLRTILKELYNKYKHDHYLVRLFSCVLTDYDPDEVGEEGYEILKDMMQSHDSYILEAAISIADSWRCLADFAEDLLTRDFDEVNIWLRRILRKSLQKKNEEEKN